MHFTEAKGLLSSKNGINIYRGCTHGCIYCDSRSVCYGMKHEFTDVEIKQNAPELLAGELEKKRKKCMIGTGSMSDPYMQCEEKLRLTRKCLEIINEKGFGAAVITKSDLILRDVELLEEINTRTKCVVQMTLTTYDEKLCKTIEPNVCTTARRFEVLCKLRDRGIPSVVWLSPLLPFINDTEENLRGILGYCFEAGVKGILNFGMGLTLREGNREYFYAQLDRHFPGLKEKYRRKYGLSYEIASENSSALYGIFKDECKKHSVMSDINEIFAYINYFPNSAYEQLTLF